MDFFAQSYHSNFLMISSRKIQFKSYNHLVIIHLAISYLKQKKRNRSTLKNIFLKSFSSKNNDHVLDRVIEICFFMQMWVTRWIKNDKVEQNNCGTTQIVRISSQNSALSQVLHKISLIPKQATSPDIKLNLISKSTPTPLPSYSSLNTLAHWKISFSRYFCMLFYPSHNGIKNTFYNNV